MVHLFSLIKLSLLGIYSKLCCDPIIHGNTPFLKPSDMENL